MPRQFSLNALRSVTAPHDSDVAVVLAVITHPDLADPIRLSTDPTERLSVEPLAYGTRSNGLEYLYVLMSIQLPDDTEDEPPRTALVFENVDTDLVPLIRSSAQRGSVSLYQVMASDPDLVQVAYEDLKTSGATYNELQVSLNVTREMFAFEPFPAQLMSKSRFPGLFPQ